jgi:hypothetical protein
MVPYEWPDTKIWMVVDGELARSDGTAVPWRIDGQHVMRNVHTCIEVWEFNGLILRPRDHPENDEWLASAQTPLPVMMMAAGLI